MKVLFAIGEPFTAAKEFASDSLKDKEVGFTSVQSVKIKKIVFLPPSNLIGSKVETWETVSDFTSYKGGGIDAGEFLKHL